MTSYADFYRLSLEQPDSFWAEQARLIDWHAPPLRIRDYDHPPFARWFAGGTTNLCHNAVDRHLVSRPDQAALITVSTETGLEKQFSFRQLHAEVQRMTAALRELGVNKGDRVLIYMPMIAEGLVNRKLAARTLQPARDHLWDDLRAKHLHAEVPCEWVDATHPSYSLFTSGTTGKPKGVQRDTGGYAVALAASMQHIFCGNAGETYFSTSDIGWVVGHSYIVYGPLIPGMATILYEGLPTRPDGGVW